MSDRSTTRKTQGVRASNHALSLTITRRPAPTRAAGITLAAVFLAGAWFATNARADSLAATAAATVDTRANLAGAAAVRANTVRPAVEVYATRAKASGKVGVTALNASLARLPTATLTRRAVASSNLEPARISSTVPAELANRVEVQNDPGPIEATEEVAPGRPAMVDDADEPAADNPFGIDYPRLTQLERQAVMLYRLDRQVARADGLIRLPDSATTPVVIKDGHLVAGLGCAGGTCPVPREARSCDAEGHCAEGPTRTRGMLAGIEGDMISRQGDDPLRLPAAVDERLELDAEWDAGGALAAGSADLSPGPAMDEGTAGISRAPRDESEVGLAAHASPGTALNDLALELSEEFGEI